MDGVRILDWLVPALPEQAVDWDAVYREEMPRVFNYFRYRGFDRATAEDLTSATFEKAWLLAIARNAATDHLRRARLSVPLADESLRDEETPETQALREAQCRRLRALVGELPERERELLALKYGAEATNRAIATITGLGESNVGTILHRTIGALRDRWTKEEPSE
jgi:RNA polymerase sigma-70 factor (ECF subfamily)